MAVQNKKTNVLLIMTDNQPADLLGCYGNPEIFTPHLDRLAQQGLQFENAFCPSGMCSPSRASVLTGLMPSQHGIHTWLDDRVMEKWPQNWNALAEFDTLPEILKTAGYKTAILGKYHVGNPYKPQNGFDHWVTYPTGHTADFWNNTFTENDHQVTYPGHAVDYLTEKAVDFIHTHNPDYDPPFFLFLTYNAPYGHKPAIAGPPRNRHAERYKTCPMQSVPRESLSREAILRFELKRHQSGGGIDYSDELTTPNDLEALRNYYSQMSMVDEGVGQVLAALQVQGLEADTLVVFTSDHGFSLGRHGFWGHGQATWPANTHRAAFHSPLLIRHTAHIRPLQSAPQILGSVDLFATLLDYLGVDLPTKDANTPSRSFAALLRGEHLSWENAVFMEQEETRALRTDKWLYMKRFRGSQRYPFKDALFNLVEDPEEKVNLIGTPSTAEIALALSARIETFFNRFADPRFDLWQGGTAKSNSDKPWLWQDAWGENWEITY